jgi:hypothetical protein
MNTAILDTSSMFLQAAASYWGIPPDQLILGKQSGAIDGVFSVQLNIALTPDDLVGITHRMGQMAQPEAQEQEDPVFVPDDLNLEQLHDDWAALTQTERGRFKSFARYKAHRQAEQFDEYLAQNPLHLPNGRHPAFKEVVSVGCEQPSEGVGGRKVQHVDVAEEQEAVSELPAAVWVHWTDMQTGQKEMSSDWDELKQCYLLQVALLTAEQKAKYCGKQKP